MKKFILISILSCCLFLIIDSCKHQSEPAAKLFYNFNNKGEINRPMDYRTWVFVGSATTPKSHDSTAIFPDFQNVYIDPISYQFWKEKGYYREGTIFVKELLRNGDSISPIGRGFYQGPAYSLSCTIKDTVRYPDVKGGWQYFKFTNYEKMRMNASSAPLGGTCISCHKNSKEGFGPFTEYYQTLLDAKNYGKDNPENAVARRGLDEDMKHIKE